MLYRPSRSSAYLSFLVGIAPIMVAVVLIVTSSSVGPLVWVWIAASAVLGLYFIVVSTRVHSAGLELTDSEIARIAATGTTRIPWADVVSATLRERNNATRRADRLLVIESRTARFDFNTSTLSRDDEDAVLSQVRRHARLVVVRDRGLV